MENDFRLDRQPDSAGKIRSLYKVLLMPSKPLILEHTYNAPIQKVWEAISDAGQMKEWYFDIGEFKPEKGFKFEFTGGDENVQFTHHCEVLEARPPHVLKHTWTYPDYPGYSVLTWELIAEGDSTTRVKLSHEGLDSFPQDNPNFREESFLGGWTYILKEGLASYLEK